MNNSKIAIEGLKVIQESEVDRNPALQKRKAEFIRVIEAIDGVTKSKDWQTLNELIFKAVVETLEKTMKAEMKKRPLEEQQIYFLQGQLVWADKYSNLEQLKEKFKVELQHIRKQLK